MSWTDISNKQKGSNIRNKLNPSGRLAQAIRNLGAERKITFTDGDSVATLLTKLDDTFLQTSSYMAFCTNYNATTLNIAFGKNNEEKIMSIGKQLAMYAWFKGTSQSVLFTNLITKQTLEDILDDADAYGECASNSYICDLLIASDYALSTSKLKFPLSNSTARAVVASTSAYTGSSSNMTAISGDVSIGTLTVPYDGTYRICPRVGMSSTYINGKILKNGNAFLTLTRTGDDEAYTFEDVYSNLSAGDVLNLIIYTSSSTSKTYYNRGLYLATIRDISLPETITPGDYPIWIAPVVRSNTALTYSERFTCAKAGTYRFHVGGKLYSTSTSYCSIQVNDVDYSAITTNFYVDIVLNVGDTVRGKVRGGGSSEQYDSILAIFTANLNAQINTYPVVVI